jgi:hypothetical protein
MRDKRKKVAVGASKSHGRRIVQKPAENDGIVWGHRCSTWNPSSLAIMPVTVEVVGTDLGVVAEN